jgi:hypothetical protein
MNPAIGGCWIMLNDVDIGYLESAFTHLEMATFLVGNMDDALIADELAKPLAEVSRRTAELLDEPYGPQAGSTGKPDVPPAATEPMGGDKSEEFEFTRLMDDLRESVARADAFSRAVEHLAREISGKMIAIIVNSHGSHT